MTGGVPALEIDGISRRYGDLVALEKPTFDVQAGELSLARAPRRLVIGGSAMPSRVSEHPFLTLMAAVSAVMILVGRIDRHLWWGVPLFAAGILVLVVAGLVFVVESR